jgi:hypothetical protein
MQGHMNVKKSRRIDNVGRIHPVHVQVLLRINHHKKHSSESITIV